nr:prephenate dehydrogenase/arogenate dehydrogenase family protein [Nocardioidaceae bacterium]
MTDPVLIVGTGLVGTSLGLALSAAGRDVRLLDLDLAALATAVALGAGSTEPSERAGCVVVA